MQDQDRTGSQAGYREQTDRRQAGESPPSRSNNLAMKQGRWTGLLNSHFTGRRTLPYSWRPGTQTGQKQNCQKNKQINKPTRKSGELCTDMKTSSQRLSMMEGAS